VAVSVPCRKGWRRFVFAGVSGAGADLGFTLLTSDIAIGRRTKQSAIRAYETMRPKWKFLGILTFLVPVLIMTYYAVIGGWITKYAVVYLTGQSCCRLPRTAISPALSPRRCRPWCSLCCSWA